MCYKLFTLYFTGRLLSIRWFYLNVWTGVYLRVVFEQPCFQMQSVCKLFTIEFNVNCKINYSLLLNVFLIEMPQIEQLQMFTKLLISHYHCSLFQETKSYFRRSVQSYKETVKIPRDILKNKILVIVTFLRSIIFKSDTISYNGTLLINWHVKERFANYKSHFNKPVNRAV